MSRRFCASIALAAAGASGLATSALARPVFTPFNNEAAFVTANGGSTALETFDTAPQGDFLTLPLPLFTINATKANDADILPGSSFGNINGTPFFEGFVSTPVDVSDTVELLLNAPTTGFGATFKDAGSGAGVAVFADGVFVTSLTSTGFSTVFFGFNSDTPFSTIQLRRSGDNTTFGEIFDVDNVRLASVPEPAMAIALVAVLPLLARRRRSR